MKDTRIKIIALIFILIYITGAIIVENKKEETTMVKLKLKKDLVIPAGTLLDQCGNLMAQYGSEDFEHVRIMGDGQVEIYVNLECVKEDPDMFEIVED